MAKHNANPKSSKEMSEKKNKNDGDTMIVKNDEPAHDIKKEMNLENEEKFDALVNNGKSNLKYMFPSSHSHTYDDVNDSGTEEEQLAFVKEIESFFKERSLEFKAPKFYGNNVDCLKLYRIVARMGGYEKVNSSKLWKQVGTYFKPPRTCTTLPALFKGFYEKALLDYEKHEIHGGELSTPIPSETNPLNLALDVGNWEELIFGLKLSEQRCETAVDHPSSSFVGHTENEEASPQPTVKERRKHGVMQRIMLKKLKDHKISVEKNYKGLHADVKDLEDKALVRWIKEMTVWKEEQNLHRELHTTGIILSKSVISCLLSGTLRLNLVKRSLKVDSVVGRNLKVIIDQVETLSVELDEELDEDGIGHSSDHFLNALQCLEDPSRGTDIKEKLIECRRHVNMMENKSESVGLYDRKGFSTFIHSIIKTAWDENAVVSISAKKYREIGFRLFVVLCGFCLKVMPIRGSSGKFLEFLKYIKIRVRSVSNVKEAIVKESIVKEVDQLLKELLSIKKIRLQKVLTVQEMKTHYRRYYHLCKSKRVFFAYPSSDVELLNELYFDEYMDIIFGLLVEIISKLSNMQIYFEKNPNESGSFEECETSLKMLEDAMKNYRIGNRLLHKIKERWK